MLSARAYSFHQKSKLAISLSWIGGFTNVVTFLVCHWFTSHVTGTATHFGRSFVAHETHSALFYGFLLVSFFSGAMLSAIMTEGARRRGWRTTYVLPMAFEAALLSLFAAGLVYHTDLQPDESFTRYWMTGVAALAMGLQNATITKISGDVVRTTHLTGVLTDLGLEGVQLALWYFDKLRSRRAHRIGRLIRISQRHPSVLRVLLLGSIFGSFLFGVVAGTYVFMHGPNYSLLLPIGFLLFIVYQDLRKPIADVRELDLLSDPDLKIAGFVRAMLPAELGLYRLCNTHAGHSHRAPSFSHWVDRLPEHWRVIILAVSPLTRLDSNAVMDLQAAVQKILSQRRRLIISGLTTSQYRALDQFGLTSLMAVEDLCPDLELAIARGLNLVHDGNGR